MPAHFVRFVIFADLKNRMMSKKRVAFTSLGCKLNFSETSWIAQKFESAGYERVDDGLPADVYIINTCTVTELANKKSRQAIHKIVNRKPDTIIVAVGCYSQLNPDEVASISGVDYVLGSDNKMDAIKLIDNLSKQPTPIVATTGKSSIFEPVYSFGDRTRSFFKVQDGCDYFCSYCAIPHARGRSRSNTVTHTLEVAREAVAKGIKEIVLTGVNIGDFGRANGESLYQLLIGLEQIDGLERLRISSIEPNLLTDQIIEHVATSKVIMPHFHIPLQCGTDRLLKLMRRRYDRQLFADKILRVKQLMPDACIAADVIVGVPTESEQDFDEARDFIRSMPLSYLHVFPYSERANTIAVRMPMVPNEIRKHRSQMLIESGRQMSATFIGGQIGRLRPVLFAAEPFNTNMYGFTDNYIRVKAKADAILINTIQNVHLEQMTDDGEVIGIID